MAQRRTQADRRHATIRTLFDAATETLIEVGHAGATVQAICARAGVSQGGLFRHFPTREALLAAVGEDVGARLLADFRHAVAALAADGAAPSLERALELLRARCRSRLNQAWYELSLASRTRPALRRALAPVSARYHDAIEQLAREVDPALAAALGDRFRLVLDTVVAIFDGEVVHGLTLEPDPAADAARLVLVVGMIRQLAAPPRRRR